MRAFRIVGVVVAFLFLLAGTVMVFLTFDRASHSASDILRPFLITMAPVWAVAVAGVWALVRAPGVPDTRLIKLPRHVLCAARAHSDEAINADAKYIIHA